MTTAAFLTGATRGFLYLRGEYAFMHPHLEATLARRRQQQLLGVDIAGHAGFSFDIDIHLGAGAYVCGEESALIESLEGKRGIPRNRPPYPTTHGYLGLPTAVNNVETLAALPLIMCHGDAWWRTRGTQRSTGTKVHSVSGDVARPGIYEFPEGTTVAEILAAAGAANTLAVQVGGPSGTLLGSNDFHRRIAREDVPSAGAFMVFDHTRDILHIVANFARFFAHESCGFCTPCRVGTTLVKQMTERLVAGRGTRRDIKDLRRVADVLRASSHCGLGHTAANPVVDALERFRPTFERTLSLHEFLPTFDLDEALAPAREATGRDDALAHLHEELP
jgi:[NiFe] hydrogenase diaphorase moiety large subunit